MVLSHADLKAVPAVNFAKDKYPEQRKVNRTMKCNLGKTERLIRVIGGLTVFCVGSQFHQLLMALGGLIFLTAIVGWCPISAILGFSTCEELEEIPADTTREQNNHDIPDRRFK